VHKYSMLVQIEIRHYQDLSGTLLCLNKFIGVDFSLI
jgi:hypothetical protein